MFHEEMLVLHGEAFPEPGSPALSLPHGREPLGSIPAGILIQEGLVLTFCVVVYERKFFKLGTSEHGFAFLYLHVS